MVKSSALRLFSLFFSNKYEKYSLFSYLVLIALNAWLIFSITTNPPNDMGGIIMLGNYGLGLGACILGKYILSVLSIYCQFSKTSSLSEFQVSQAILLIKLILTPLGFIAIFSASFQVLQHSKNLPLSLDWINIYIRYVPIMLFTYLATYLAYFVKTHFINSEKPQQEKSSQDTISLIE